MKVTYKGITHVIKWYESDWWFFRWQLLKIRFAEWLYPDLKKVNFEEWDQIKIED